MARPAPLANSEVRTTMISRKIVTAACLGNFLNDDSVNSVEAATPTNRHEIHHSVACRHARHAHDIRL